MLIKLSFTEYQARLRKLKYNQKKHEIESHVNTNQQANPENYHQNGNLIMNSNNNQLTTSITVLNTPTNVLYVTNLKQNVTIDQLYKLFGKKILQFF